MKVLKTLLLSTVVAAAAVTPALARDNVKILGARYGGSGCPVDSASVSVSPDGQELTVLFDEFAAFGNSRRERRKSCNLSIPIKVPDGFQVSLYNADYRGYVAPRTRARFSSEYFFAGQRGPRFVRQFQGETDYNVRDRIGTAIWSACGDSVNMRVNAAMTAYGSGMATVDSFDLAHRGLVYHIKYRSCRR